LGNGEIEKISGNIINVTFDETMLSGTGAAVKEEVNGRKAIYFLIAVIGVAVSVAAFLIWVFGG